MGLPAKVREVGRKTLDTAGNVLLRPPLGGFGRAYLHGPSTSRKIALTFDDGPNDPSTNEVLDILAKYEAKATFFCVGANAALNPQLVKRAYNEGHVIGNHSMHHSRKSGLVFHDESHIDECTETLRNIIGVTPRLYRAPWGWLTPWETNRLNQRNFSIIGWNIYTYDWQTPPPNGEDIAARVKQDAKSGAIVLFHDGIPGTKEAKRPQTVKAVEKVITNLRADGYQFVTISDLLNIPAYD